MGFLKKAGIIIFLLVLGTSITAAMQHEASADKGKALFNDPKLGTSGKSCNDCHPAGKGIEKAAGKKDLEKVINACITGALQGKPLDVKSVEMQSLVKYINSLSSAKKQETKKAPVGC